MASDPIEQTEEVTMTTPAKQEKVVSSFRETLPQVLASTANNFFRMNVSLSLGFATVVIAQLHHSGGDLSLDDNHASWLGSVAYICQPLGSVASGVIVELIGRKKFLILINFPFLLGLVLLCTAPSFPVLMLANVIIGITVGLTEAPNNSYNGEVCQPGVRGVMSASSGIFYQLGFFMQYLLGTLTFWRTAAGISTVIPISTFICLCMIPEVPIWLISRGRIKDAEKALCCLRGWVQPSAVQQELTELIRYHEETKIKKKIETQVATPEIIVTDSSAKPSVLSPAFVKDEKDAAPEKFQVVKVVRDLLRPPTLRPLLLVVPFFFFVHFAGLTSIKPFMVHVFRQFQMPVTAEWFTVASGGCGLVGSVLLMLSVRMLGKRFISLVGTAISAVAALLLGVYAYVRPLGDDGALAYTWVPLVLFVLLSFCNSIVEQIPSILISEVYPFRTRGLSVGISVAFCYFFIFLASKTYLDTERVFQLHGAFWFYGVISCVAYAFFHFWLVETEGKSLEDIERHFTQGLSARSREGRNKGRTGQQTSLS
ncbi:facilitated trehalose transporter Tret1-like [Periplaneta americana]|uniref:facilitated trehalose transporter Tret1-like n=1 Tax=Periplaneta americana TaxID=6978 RepID=UPI0037E75BA3